jgi:RNA polymerase sigma-70 factor (ECF subfamily)
MKGAEPYSDELSLLADLKSGGEAAFNYFYDKYSLQLYRKLLKMVQADVIAEELLQDLFMKIWEKREQIDPEQPFKSYLYRIAERIVYDYFRKLAREAKASDFIKTNSTEIYEQFDSGGLESELRNKVQNAIARLPEQQRAVFNLCKIEGKSYEEASALLGITVGTINTHITRATKTIKGYLSETDNLALILSIGLLIGELK